VRERKLEQGERGVKPFHEPFPRNFSAGGLAGASEVEVKQGWIQEQPVLSLAQRNKPEGSYAFGVGVDATVESHRSLKASAPRLQPGTGVETVTFEVKQESKFETAVHRERWGPDAADQQVV